MDRADLEAATAAAIAAAVPPPPPPPPSIAVTEVHHHHPPVARGDVASDITVATDRVRIALHDDITSLQTSVTRQLTDLEVWLLIWLHVRPLIISYQLTLLAEVREARAESAALRRDVVALHALVAGLASRSPLLPLPQ